MGRFTFAASKIHFGHTAGDTSDDGEGLPPPCTIALKARRTAGIAEARGVLKHLPGKTESLHALVTARLDLTDVVNVLLEKLGKCRRVLIATLGYNKRNLGTLLSWLDGGQVESLTLLASKFFRAHNGGLWKQTVAEMATRNARVACCYSHCKVIVLQFENAAKMVIEGSANLSGNGSGREQFALINHPVLADWHFQWIDEWARKFEGKEDGDG